MGHNARGSWSRRRGCGGRVEFKEHFRDRNEFAQELADADAFVHPNPREPFGITPLEAMACGVPVVAPRAGGVLSYAGDYNAWLCEPTADDFAKAVQSIFADASDRERRVSAARLTAQEFDWTVIAARYFQLIDTLHERGFRIEIPPLGAAVDAWRNALAEQYRARRVQSGVGAEMVSGSRGTRMTVRHERKGPRRAQCV
jgi:glycogen synthase